MRAVDKFYDFVLSIFYFIVKWLTALTPGKDTVSNMRVGKRQLNDFDSRGRAFHVMTATRLIFVKPFSV